MRRSPSSKQPSVPGAIQPVHPVRPHGSSGTKGSTTYADGRTVKQTRSRAQQNVSLRRHNGPTISSHSIDWFLREKKQKAEQIAQLAPYQDFADTRLQPQVFTTSAIVPTSLNSYSPSDPRANPLMTMVAANGGFLPAPPI